MNGVPKDWLQLSTHVFRVYYSNFASRINIIVYLLQIQIYCWQDLPIVHMLHCIFINCTFHSCNSVNCMEYSPAWEANNCSDRQDIPHILRNLQVPYQANKSLPVFLTQRQMITVSILQSYFFKIHLSIILSPVPRTSNKALFSDFSNWSFVCISLISHAFYFPFTSHPPAFVYPNNILWRLQIMKFLIM